jgi:hypothetical protein
MVVLLLALQAITGGSQAERVAIPASCMVAGCGGDIPVESTRAGFARAEAVGAGVRCGAGAVRCANGPEPVLAWRKARIRFEPVRLPAVALPRIAPPVSDPDSASPGAEPVAAEAAPLLTAGLSPGSSKSGRLVRRRSGDDVAGRQLYEYSDGFYARLALHRLASYGTLPLFVTQYFAGEELLRNVDHAAGWARAIHGPAAAGVAVLFLVNTVTGGMNMIEGIRDPADRGRRTVHSLLMLIADAGFVWTGVTASGAGRYKPDSNELRTLHKKVALGSMGVATLGYMIMIPPFRK